MDQKTVTVTGVTVSGEVCSRDSSTHPLSPGRDIPLANRSNSANAPPSSPWLMSYIQYTKYLIQINDCSTRNYNKKLQLQIDDYSNRNTK